MISPVGNWGWPEAGELRDRASGKMTKYFIMIIVYIILKLFVAHWPRYHKLDIHRVLSVKCVSVCVLCVLNRTDSKVRTICLIYLHWLQLQFSALTTEFYFEATTQLYLSSDLWLSVVMMTPVWTLLHDEILGGWRRRLQRSPVGASSSTGPQHAAVDIRAGNKGPHEGSYSQRRPIPHTMLLKATTTTFKLKTPQHRLVSICVLIDSSM